MLCLGIVKRGGGNNLKTSPARVFFFKRVSLTDADVWRYCMGYSYLKLIHLIAVMGFLCNIITGLFWMNVATRTKDIKIINFVRKGIIKSDRIFTIPGVIIITAGGFLTAKYGQFPIRRTGCHIRNRWMRKC